MSTTENAYKQLMVRIACVGITVMDASNGGRITDRRGKYVAQLCCRKWAAGSAATAAAAAKLGAQVTPYWPWAMTTRKQPSVGGIRQSPGKYPLVPAATRRLSSQSAIM